MRTPTLDAYLASFSDRCDDCGAHTVQPHRDDCRISGDTSEWAIFLAALRAAEKGGEVHQGDVRPLIVGRIAPKRIGLAYKRAIREGVLTFIRKEPSTDERGRNTHHDSPVYELRSAA